MPAPQRDVRICFFGDSYLNGTLDETYLGWPARLCSALPLQVTHYNLGIRGNTSVDIERRWEDEASRRLKAATEHRLVFSFGTNDASLEGGTPRVSLRESVQSAKAILTRAKQRCPVLFMGPPAVELQDGAAAFARLEALSFAYGELAQSLEVPYLDLFVCTHRNDVWHAAVKRGDGVHPDAAGYELLAGFVAAWPAWQAWW